MKPDTDWGLAVAIVSFAIAAVCLTLAAFGAFMAFMLGGAQ